MLIDILFCIVLVVCFITDCREQKIYNIVVLPSIMIVIILNSWYSGFDGFRIALLGLAAGLSILLIPYLMGGMGAGDVKLLAFIGAAKGASFVLNSAIYMALVGGVVSLAILIHHKQATSFFKSIFSWLRAFIIGFKVKIEFSNSKISNKFPYGTAIVAGGLICLLFKEAWIV